LVVGELMFVEVNDFWCCGYLECGIIDVFLLGGVIWGIGIEVCGVVGACGVGGVCVCCGCCGCGFFWWVLVGCGVGVCCWGVCFWSCCVDGVDWVVVFVLVVVFVG